MFIIHFFLLSQDELDLTEENRAAMFSLPAEKKWQLYCSKKLVRNYDYSHFICIGSLYILRCWAVAFLSMTLTCVCVCVYVCIAGSRGE